MVHFCLKITPGNELKTEATGDESAVTSEGSVVTRHAISVAAEAAAGRLYNKELKRYIFLR